MTHTTSILLLKSWPKGRCGTSLRHTPNLISLAVSDFRRLIYNTHLTVHLVLPGFVYGPYAEHIPLPSQTQLGTNSFILGLIKGGTPPQPPPLVVDARDVGRAHVLALELPRKPAGEKRYFVNGGLLSWQDATKVIAKSHPDIKTIPQPDLPGPPSNLDLSKVQRDLKFGEFRTPESTIIDTVDALIALQKTWA
jgi:nucleoside-diphosphate-sugar epimerase